MRRTLFALTALLLLSSLPAAAQVDFAIDSTRSNLTVSARLNTLVGSASDTEETSLAGSIQAYVSESEIHITDGSIRLADSLRLRFSFGGAFNIGSITAAASPSAISLDVVAPGPPSAVEGGEFGQGGNEMALQGMLYLTADGLLAPYVPTDPQVIAAIDTVVIGGTLELDSLYRLTIPFQFSGSFDLGNDATATLTLRGDIYAEAPSTVAAERPFGDSRLSFGMYPNPTRGFAQLTVTNPKAQNVSVELYDLQGRRAAVVVDRFLPPGVRAFEIDVSALAAGVYMAVVTWESSREAIPLVVME